MKSRKRLGSDNVMNIDGFADGNAISDLNSDFRRKQAGDYRANQEQTKEKPGDNQEARNQETTKSKQRRNQEGAPGGKQKAIRL